MRNVLETAHLVYPSPAMQASRRYPGALAAYLSRGPRRLAGLTRRIVEQGNVPGFSALPSVLLRHPRQANA
jgi:hypothetical protein